MAGATNRALKAAGVPKATIATLRVEQGGHLSLKSAISIAHERGLDTGKAHEFMAKRDAKKAAAPASQAATADFRSKAAATMKAAGERTAKEGRAAVLAARLRDRAANALGTNRGDIANARADRILKANPGARGLAEQLRGERRFETKSAVNQTMRLGQVSRSNFNLPATRSERVAGLLSSMKAKEAQSAARRADMKKAQQAAAPTDGKKRRAATDFYAPPSRGPSKREKQAIRDARDVILGPRAGAAKPAMTGARPFNAERHLAKANAVLTKREDNAKQAQKQLSGLLAAKAPARDIAAAYTAQKRAAAAQDKAFDRYASAKDRADTAKEARATAQAAPKFKGAGPLNADRHKARAMALSEARKAQLATAEAKFSAVRDRYPSTADVPQAALQRHTANLSAALRATVKARDAVDRAAALNRSAGAKVSERDAVRRGEKGTRDVQMRQARSDLAGLRAPGGNRAHIMTAEGPKTVDAVASSKNFFVHKEPGYGGRFVVSHRDTGMGVASANTLSGAKRIMDGMKKTGHLTMKRLEQGGAAGERSARAMAKYLSAPKRRNVSLAERGSRAGSAPTRRGKEANKAAGI